MNEPSFKGRYNTVMPYLIINNASMFIDFMKEVFNAEETWKGMRDDNLIMHAEVKLGDTTIMFADATEEFKVQNAGMFVCVDDADATFNKAVDHGAKVVMPISDQNYGRSGGVEDPFGNTWWITNVK